MNKLVIRLLTSVILLVTTSLASAGLMLDTKLKTDNIFINTGDTFDVDVVATWYNTEKNDPVSYLNTASYAVNTGSLLTFNGASFDGVVWDGFNDPFSNLVDSFSADFFLPGVASGPIVLATLSFTAGDNIGWDAINIDGAAIFVDEFFNFAGLQNMSANLDVKVVPEPSSLSLLMLSVLVLLARRKVWQGN